MVMMEGRVVGFSASEGVTTVLEALPESLSQILRR